MSDYKISILDACLYIGESKTNQKHVGAILGASYGPGQDYRYLEQLVEQLRQHNAAVAPFNLRVKHFFRIPYGFEELKTIDMNYHIQLHELEGLDDHEICNAFVANLHSQLLDRDKPMWQLHLIYDKQSSSFVLYARVHHIYGDGISMVRWVMSSMDTAPSDELPIFWQQVLCPPEKKVGSFWERVVKPAWDLLVNTKDMSWLLLRLLGRASKVNKQFMPLPFTDPHTVLTGSMASGRVLATTKIPMDEIQRTAKHLRATVNEVMLTAIDIALHQYLEDHGDNLSKNSLTCMMPMSLRKENDLTNGNKIALTLIELAKDEHDPIKRLRQIIGSTQVAKDVSQQVKPMAFIHFNLMWQLFGFVGEVTRLSNIMRPLSNIIASNVPGPQHDCYFGKCKINSLYPVSMLGPGGGINVTLVSFNGSMDIGFICSSKNVDSLESLAEYTQRAFHLLKASIQSADTDIHQLPNDEFFIEQAAAAETQPDMGKLANLSDRKIA